MNTAIEYMDSLAGLKPLPQKVLLPTEMYHEVAGNLATINFIGHGVVYRGILVERADVVLPEPVYANKP